VRVIDSEVNKNERPSHYRIDLNKRILCPGKGAKNAGKKKYENKIKSQTLPQGATPKT